MKLKPIEFSSETTPWRVVIPARFNNGKRKTKYFRLKQDAAALCREINNGNITALEDYTPAMPKSEAQEWEIAMRWAQRELGGFREIYNAVDHYKLTRLNITKATVREAFEAYQAARAGTKAPRTIASDAGIIRKFGIKYEDTQVSEITKLQLLEFIDAQGNNRLHVYKRMSTFFNWLRQRDYLGANPMEGIDSKQFGKVGVNNEFYPIAIFRRMLRIAGGLEAPRPGEEPTRDFIDLLPVLLLGGFAGLRPCETFRNPYRKGEAMRWNDLYFSGVEIPHVLVRHEVAKRTKRKSDKREVDMGPALAALEAWLSLVPRHDEYIVRYGSRKFQDIKAEFSRRTGIKFLENGLRNSFATYALSYSTLSGLGHVSKQMGNSEAICREHYAQNLPTGSGKRWFDLRPYEVVEPVAVSA